MKKITSHQLPTNLKSRQENFNGFTLIEILIALTITGLIFSFGFTNFREYSRRQALNGLERMVLGDIRNTQEKALSGQKPNDIVCNSPEILESYTFEVVTDIQYKIETVCTGGNYLIKTVDLQSNMTIQNTSAVNPIEFKSLGNGTNINSGQTVVITLTQTDSGETRDIEINHVGDIE